MTRPEHIYPLFDKALQRGEKERLLQQRSKVVWMTGLSGSGKSTIALGLERKLHDKGFLTQMLDGDNVRTGLNSDLGFAEGDRQENIRRIAEVAKLFCDCGVFTIACFVSPTVAMREKARSIVGEEDFLEVFVDTPLEVCEQRDTKGLYQKARNGEIREFTGIDAPFEEPEVPDLRLKTQDKDVEASVDEALEQILPMIRDHG
jgi:adenylylsulfate kinase